MMGVLNLSQNAEFTPLMLKLHIFFFSRYEVESTYFDESVRNAKRQQLKSKVLDVRLQSLFMMQYTFLILIKNLPLCFAHASCAICSFKV